VHRYCRRYRRPKQASHQQSAADFAYVVKEMEKMKMKQFLMRSVWMVAILLIGPTVMAEPTGTAYLDKIVFGQEADGVRTVAGAVHTETLDTEMGAIRGTWTVHTLPGKGAEMEFDVSAPTAAGGLILEIQEIHDRRPGAYGYTVLVNGTEVYFRTYQELGAGPSHFFVEVPPALVRPEQPLTVSLRHDGGGPFSLGTVWVWENFVERVAQPERVYRKMGLLIPPGSVKFEGEPGAGRGPKDDAWWLRRFEALQERFANLQDFEPIGTLGFGGSYGGGDPRSGRESLRQGLRLSAATSMPGEMILNGLGWFSGPTGPDGLGGYFSDIRYDKSGFNREKGVFQTSYPNLWASTPAFTLRDPNLNHFLEMRFQQMMRGTAEKIAQLRLEGTPAHPIIVREFAPASGEITDQIIRAAARDGVTLDPSDGMSLEERMWMHRDAVRTWQEYADSLLHAMGRDIAVIDQGTLHLPEEQTFDNFYAHPNFMTDAPAGDPRWGGGQHGMVDGLWSSGEIGATSGHRDIEEDAATKFRDVVMYDYLPANGKFASINLERTMLKEDFTVLRMYYERGAQFVTLFNADDGDENFVRGVDGFSNDPVSPPPHAQPVVAMEPVDSGSAEGETTFHREELFRLTNAGDPFMTGFSLSLDGRVSPGDANRIEIFLGPAADDLALVTTLREADLPDPDHWTPRQTSMARVDLGESMVGKTEAYLKIVYHAEGAADAAFLIERKVETRWPRRSGYTEAPSLTRKDARTLNLWLQERSVARRLLRYYRDIGGQDEIYRQARTLFDRGWYASVRRLLSPQISQVLPARYLVRGHGTLGRHPVKVALPDAEDTLFVTLEDLDAEGVQFVLMKDPIEGGEQSVELRFPELDTARRWIVETLEGGRYWLRPADPGQRDGRVTVEDGAVVVLLAHADASETDARALPERLTARFQGMRGQQITVDIQELELMNYSGSMSIPTVRGVKHTREAAALEHPELADSQWPRNRDEVRLRIDEKGRVTEIHSRYGYDKGRIAKFQPPVIVGGASNGWIELENGNRYELVFEKQSGHFDTVALQGPLTGYEVNMLEDAIKPGHEVEVFFSPYTAKGGLPRIGRVLQPRTVLLDVDFTQDEDGAWREATHRIDGVNVVPHRPEPNYLYRVEMPLMRPVEHFTPGHVIYRIEHDKPLKTTAVEFAARAFEDSSRVTFSTSPDGEDWTRIGQFDKTWQNNISQSLQGLPYQFLDLTPAVEGLTAFYLKVELAVNSADHRFCLAKLRVATEAETAE
jgi:hypothetical protein